MTKLHFQRNLRKIQVAHGVVEECARIGGARKRSEPIQKPWRQIAVGRTRSKTCRSVVGQASPRTGGARHKIRSGQTPAVHRERCQHHRHHRGVVHHATPGQRTANVRSQGDRHYHTHGRGHSQLVIACDGIAHTDVGHAQRRPNRVDETSGVHHKTVSVLM